MGALVQLITPLVLAKQHALAMTLKAAQEAFGVGTEQYTLFTTIAADQIEEARTVGEVDRAIKLLIGSVLFVVG